MAERDIKSPRQALLGEDQQQENTPQTLHDLQTALLDSKIENKKLAEEITALKQQLVSKEQERKTLQDDMESLASTLAWTRSSLENLGQESESAKAREAWYNGRQREMEQFIHAKTHELNCCMADLDACRSNNNRLNLQVIEKDKKIEDMELAFAQSLGQFNATWQNQMSVKEKKAASELQSLQKSYDGKIDRIIKEKDEEISMAKMENMALEEKNVECTLHLQDLKTELQECETKFNALHQMTVMKEEKAASELQALHEKIDLIIKEKEEEISRATTESMALVKKNMECTFMLQDLNSKLQECEAKFNALHQMTVMKEEKAASELQALHEKTDVIMTEKEEEMTRATTENMALAKKNMESTFMLQDLNSKLQECEAKFKALHQMTANNEKRAATELHAVRWSCKVKVDLIMTENEEKMATATNKITTLTKNNVEYALKLNDTNIKLQQCEADCEARVSALQESLEQEKNEKEELHKKRIDTEESWLNRERLWLLKARRMEEDLQRLTTENTGRQELASRTDKEKAKIKKEEEKRLKKEQKNQEKKEKEERKKNEKREKRERKEQEKKEREEREHNEKREKRERKEQEKREREEREQNEKREKRERKEKEREEKARRKRMRENEGL